MEGRPTAFRSPDREELLPTLKQLQARHPDTLLMWFAKGRYWRSPLDMRPERPRERTRSGLAKGASRAPSGRDRFRPQGRPGARRPGPRKGRSR